MLSVFLRETEDGGGGKRLNEWCKEIFGMLLSVLRGSSSCRFCKFIDNLILSHYSNHIFGLLPPSVRVFGSSGLSLALSKKS